MLDIRQLLIDWALTRGIDVPEEENWRLVFDEPLDSMNP